MFQIEKLHEKNNCPSGEELLSLARGPIQYVRSFSGYVTNGYRFHTSQRDTNRRTQNSGVVVLGETGNGSEAIDFYGVLRDVVRLEYLGGNYVVFFHCDWYDVLDSRKGLHVDKFWVVSVDTQRFLKVDEPFVLASQVSQVFYATNVIKKGTWRVAVKTKPRVTYEMEPSQGSDSQNLDMLDDVEDAYQERESFAFTAPPSVYTHSGIDIEETVDVEPEIIDATTLVKKRKRNT